MSLYAQVPIRLEADLISQPPVTPLDANTGLPIQFWARQGIAFQCAVFDAQGVAVDLSNLEYLQLVLQPAQDSLVPSLVKTVLAGAIIPVISHADWLAGVAQQVQFLLSNAETDLALGGANEATYWLQFQGRTTGGANIVYAAGSVRIFNPGSGLPAPENRLTSFHRQNSAGGNLLITPASQIHTEEIVVSGAAGTRDVVIGATGLDDGALIAVRFQLPATAGIIHRLFDQSLSGALLATITSDPEGFTPAARVGLFFDGANIRRDFLIIPAFGQQT